MQLLLIRHGQTPSNVLGALDTGVPGPGLTALGSAQAAAVPAALEGSRVEAVYVSPLIRTHLTAAPLATGRELSAEVRPGLEEIVAGDLEMRTDPESVRTYVHVVLRWGHGELALRMPGGETGHEFHQRYRAAVDGIAAAHDEDDTVAVFSHGAAIRAFAIRAAGLDDTAAALPLHNTGMVHLSGDPERGWHLERWLSDPIGAAFLATPAADDRISGAGDPD